MEWVETTGRSVEEALDAALDQLGVDEGDAEYEVLEEPKVGLFGRTRGEARIRARVRPTRPRPKDDRRDRRRRSGSGSGGGGGGRAAASSTSGDKGAAGDDGGDDMTATTVSAEDGEDRMSDTGLTGVDVPIARQGEVAAEFVQGVVERFGVDGTVSVREIDEETIEVAVEGTDLGLLIGPKGATLQSLQELARTVVQRRTSARNGRLLVDVAGYRQRRKEALERFARSAAEQVLSSGSRAVLDPMMAADRKVVHDTVNEIAGVTTTSEGEEPRRRVVILPEPSGS